MKGFAKAGWGVCLALLAVANIFLFVYMMLMMGFVGRYSFMPLFHLFNGAFIFSYYCAAPLAAFGFVCAIACAAAKKMERAALLAALSGGALFSAILVWGFFHL
jgi:hypothetical protein